MKKITLYVDDEVVDVYSGIFTRKCFDNFKKVSKETKMELSLEGIKKVSDMVLEENINDKEYCLYNAYLNMAVVSEHLIDIKIEDIK